MKNKFALIVEDDDMLGDIFNKSLRGLCATEIVTNGMTALERIKESKPDLVILDLHLPGLNGDEILKKIRANPDLSDTRVILCTANEQVAATLHDQADIVFLKPVNPSQLRQMVERLL